jgi:copper resistance protein B
MAMLSMSGGRFGSRDAGAGFLLTQRLILQPRFEMNVAVQSVPNYGIRSGVNDIELELRLRYEIRREFAPYVGISWLQSLCETATFRANGGKNTSVLQVVAGQDVVLKMSIEWGRLRDS